MDTTNGLGGIGMTLRFPLAAQESIRAAVGSFFTALKVTRDRFGWYRLQLVTADGGVFKDYGSGTGAWATVGVVAAFASAGCPVVAS